MEAVASGAAHRRWDTSGSGSRYSFRTSVSSLADIGGEIVEVDRAGGELEAEARRAAADRVFVAVPGEVKHGKSALQWALQNLAKDGAQVVVAHVHRPAQMIPMSKASFFGGLNLAMDFSEEQGIREIGCRCHFDS